MTVVFVHPDSDSPRFHLEVGRSAFQKFADLIGLSSIEVYGRPNEVVLALLYAKQPCWERTVLSTCMSAAPASCGWGGRILMGCQHERSPSQPQ